MRELLVYAKTISRVVRLCILQEMVEQEADRIVGE